MKKLISEKKEKGVIKLTLEETKNLENTLNRFLGQKYSWWIEISLHNLEYRPTSTHLTLSGNLKVNNDWFWKQWREYHYSVYPENDEISIGDVIGGHFAAELADRIKTISTMTLGVYVDRFSWYTLYLTPIET